jgi:tRNA (cytidine/uridine-2'-O-)-methyltransferase
MFNVVLVEPEIPPNTGNIIRLCANSGVRLHLIEPLGFTLDDARMRRAGLDYHEFARVQVHRDWDSFIARESPHSARLFGFTKHGPTQFSEIAFEANDWLVFGAETRGLSEALRAAIGQARCVRLPMLPENRSLNLSNAVAVVVFEAWRQHGYRGAV